MLQVLLDKRNRHTALANRRCNSLDRAQPDVAAREYARYARFEEVRVAALHPVAGFCYVIAGQNVSAAIARNLGREPLRLCVGADEHE